MPSNPSDTDAYEEGFRAGWEAALEYLGLVLHIEEAMWSAEEPVDA